MDATKIATLKHKLLTATAFTEILEYYFAEFGSNAAFARTGETMKDPRFAAALAQVVSKAVTVKGRATFEGTPLRIAAHHLIHGAFWYAKWTVMMFYFEDVKQGFMAIGDDGGPSHFTRFSFVESPDGGPIQVH
jgi:hypothetical protein